MSNDTGFAALLRHDRPADVTNLEMAQKILRIHHQCSGVACEARHSALRFVDAATSPDPQEPRP